MCRLSWRVSWIVVSWLPVALTPKLAGWLSHAEYAEGTEKQNGSAKG